MKKLSIGLFIASLMLISCGKQPGKTPSVEILLKQGPVSAWRIPLTRQGAGTIVCRYIVTGEDKPRECPVDGDSLVLTTIDQDGVLTIVHSSGREGMFASVSFKIEHPLPGDVRIDGPYAVTVESKEKTVWKTTWESSETRKPVFSVEIVAYLKPAT